LLGGSRLVVSAMDTHTDANVKLLLSPRQSRGITYWIYKEIYIFVALTNFDLLASTAELSSLPATGLTLHGHPKERNFLAS